jgi:signal transduction histidine kinase
VQCLKDDFLLKIEDNGLGFEIEAMPPTEGSNGIINMRKRAELVHLKFNLKSSIGSGTTIQLGFT